MFYNQAADRFIARFGLRRDQIKAYHPFGKNMGWYTSAGRKVGWGDLSAENMLDIACGLEEGECFIALYEQDSFWEFYHRGSSQPGTEAEPGFAYLAAHARFIIRPGEIWSVTDQPAPDCAEIADLPVFYTTRSEVAAFFGVAPVAV